MCNDFFTFAMYDFPKIVGKHIHFAVWNPFERRHGKSSQDQHFSSVSRFLSTYKLKSKLSFLKHIKKAIVDGQKVANFRKKKVLNFDQIMISMTCSLYSTNGHWNDEIALFNMSPILEKGLTKSAPFFFAKNLCKKGADFLYEASD